MLRTKTLYTGFAHIFFKFRTIVKLKCDVMDNKLAHFGAFFHSKYFLIAFVLSLSVTFAYDLSLTTDHYFYAVNETIFASGIVKINVTPISNVSVVFTVINQAGSTVSTKTFATNSTGQFNSTFLLTSTGNYTLRSNVSGDVVGHFIKVLSYDETNVVTSQPTYTSGSSGTVTVTFEDINDAGVANQSVTAIIRAENGTVINSSLTSCTTDALGHCTINFTAPSQDGEYVIEVNNYEDSVPLVVGGYDAFMKASPSIVGKDQNVTVRVTVKNANGNGITASTRQLVVTAPNGTQTTITSMTAANDSAGNTLTGVYEEKLKFDKEGAFEVKVTVQPQGSNLTRVLRGNFDVRSYLADVLSWPGSTTLFTPGQTVSLGIRLRNASTNEFMKTTQCGSGSCVTSLGTATVFDPSNVATGYSVSVSEQSSLSLYRMDITLPASAKSGNYRVQISLNDSFGTGAGAGYFAVQLAKGSMRSLDKFPNGVAEEEFLPGNKIVLEFSAANASGAVNVTSISSYTIRDEEGNDKTSIFGTGATYSGNNNKSYVNLTAPKQGGRYIVGAKLNTLLGSVNVDGWFFVDVLDIDIRPQSIGAGAGGATPFGGPGYMFAFRPNDTVTLRVEVKTASEDRGHEGYMGGGFADGGVAKGGHSIGFGGLFGIGGGANVEGAQVIVDRIINLNTEEEVTTSTTITNCITDSTGSCNVKLQSSVNGQNWTGGFHIVFVNVTTSDNQSDDNEGFFEVRRYFVDVRTRAATAKNATGAGFMTFNDWFIGPDDNLNITVNVIEPGTWSPVSQGGNATIQGVFYSGNLGEFIFPPKLQDGTTKKVNITSGNASALINAPAGGWKSGFYIVKVLVNVSNLLDTAESFFMVKIYQGFGDSINPVTKEQDFTVGVNENVSIRINVFDVRFNRPAANLTVTLSKILSFEDFPPSELSYDKGAVATGKTDTNGQAVMTLPVPSGGWPNGEFLVSFDVTNGTVSDSIPGFFQVKNFFVELSAAKWRFAANETVAFNVTISSDPSWMRQTFGGGCPAGDPMCAGGGGMPAGPAPVPIVVNHTFVPFNSSLDLDGDGQMDINITGLASPGFMFNLTGNLTAAKNNSDGTGFVGTAVAANFWCFDTRNCQQAPAPVGGNLTNGFDGVDCETGVAGTYGNKTTHNMSGPSIFCVNTTKGDKYKIQSEFANASGINIGYIKHVTGSVGGVGPVNLSGTQGFSYFNATLKSIKVIKFSFETGETLLTQGTDYNVTSATGSTIGEGKIVIPGVGSIKLVPFGTWAIGFYRVVAEFNTSLTLSETGDNGFSVETFFANCYRSSWGSVASGANISVRCDVTDPGAGGAYAGRVDMHVESVRNMFTFQNIASGATAWTSTKNFTDATVSSANITLVQSLNNGQYEARVRLNASATDVRTQGIWFEVKDFEPIFFSERWSYAASDNITLRAEGFSNNQPIAVNISGIVVYRYDKSSGAKSEVTGITIGTEINQSSPFFPVNSTKINLTKSGSWDEGEYEVIANLTKVNNESVPIGGKVEAHAWFEVKLFDVSGWSEFWSNHPKNNVTFKVHVSPSGSYWQYYNGVVRANITAVTNKLTGAVLAKGTDYNVTNMTANPSSVGDLNLTIIPLSASGLPASSYIATVQVTDVATDKSVIVDFWFDVNAFFFSTYTERYEYAASDDVVFILSVYSPSSSNTTLTGGKITYMSKCGQTTCDTVSLATLNTVFNATTNRMTILNSSNLTTGWYWSDIEVNDTQNATAKAGSGFQIKSFGISGYMQNPTPSRYSYYINETMVLNVTGTIGTNVTNATFKYWLCPEGAGLCEEKQFIIQIGRTLAVKNELINMSPPGLNSTWPTFSWGWGSYSIDVSATKDNDTSLFFTWSNVQFPYLWNITGLPSVGPTNNITVNVTVYTDYDNTQRLANAIVNVSRVLSSATWNELNTTSNAWNQSGAATNANGFAQVTVGPNTTKFNWTLGGITIKYTAKYGNATTEGYYYTTVSQKTLNILGKSIKNNTAVLTNAPSCPASCWYNLTVTINNPESTAATADVVVTTSWLNLTATINNQTSAKLTAQSIPAGASPTFNFTYNVTGITNITHNIQFIPTSADFAQLSTTFSYASA